MMNPWTGREWTFFPYLMPWDTGPRTPAGSSPPAPVLYRYPAKGLRKAKRRKARGY